jgi:hypothetical protein
MRTPSSVEPFHIAALRASHLAGCLLRAAYVALPSTFREAFVLFVEKGQNPLCKSEMLLL